MVEPKGLYRITGVLPAFSLGGLRKPDQAPVNALARLLSSGDINGFLYVDEFINDFLRYGKKDYHGLDIFAFSTDNSRITSITNFLSDEKVSIPSIFFHRGRPRVKRIDFRVENIKADIISEQYGGKFHSRFNLNVDYPNSFIERYLRKYLPATRPIRVNFLKGKIGSENFEDPGINTRNPYNYEVVTK